MALTREEAWQHLGEWTKTDSLRKHARAVEIVMRRAAHLYGGGAGDEEAWGIAGMLHDADYEKWPEEHPNRIVGRLRELGEERIAHAISAHHTKWNVPFDTLLSKALIAADELTGFTVACCLVRPDNQLTLTTANGDHAVDGFDSCLQWFMHRFSGRNARSHVFQWPVFTRFYWALSV